MDMKGLREEMVADYVALFHEGAVLQALRQVRYMAPVCMLVLTFTAGALPLLSRIVLSDDKIRDCVAWLRASAVYTAVCMAGLCACAGQLVAAVFCNVLPTIRTRIYGNNTYPGPEIYLTLGFLVAWLMQETLSMPYGASDRDDDDRWHLYIAQFVRGRVYKNEKHRKATPNGGEPSCHSGKFPEVGAGGAAALRSSGSAGQEVQASWLTWKTYLGVTVLCLHSILDGFCVGLQPSVQQTWYISSTIMVYRIVIAVPTVIELLDLKVETKSILGVLLIFSVMPSIGCLLTLLVGSMDVSVTKLGGLLGLSGGSLLYVAFFELLRVNKQKHLHGVRQWLATFTGCSLSMIYCLWTNGVPVYSLEELRFDAGQYLYQMTGVKMR